MSANLRVSLADLLNNRLTSSDLYTITYDAMGNIKTKYNKLTKETSKYTFNARNRLIEYVKQDENNQTIKTLTFTYDAFGRRVSKTEDGTVQKYLYDGDDIIAILDAQNNVIATITHDESIDTPLSITNANGTFYYHRDHQGSIIALTDSLGAVVESFTYDNHYGAIISHTKTVETNNPYGYTGREVDAPELYYYRARYYDPTIQRFLSEDPIGFASGDFNWYRYVADNPVNLVDPEGLWCISLGVETRNVVETPIGAPWWKIDGIQKLGKTGILMCYWGKYQKMRRSREERSRKICYECDDPDPCYGRTPSCDIKMKYGKWHTIIDTYTKKVGGGSSSGFATGAGRAECGPGPSPYLPHSGL